MASKVITTPYDELTYKIIGCAMAVHRKLGPGYREDTYQHALENSLAGVSLSFQTQKLYSVYDDPGKQQLIGYYIPDFVVADMVVVEIKALSSLDNSHLAQVIGYLAITGCPIGLLINFGEQSLRHRRVLPPRKVMDQVVNRQWLFVPDQLKGERS
jgi:GxxExxY protein